MAEDIENHTIRLLQEIRAEVHGLRGEVHDLRGEVDERFTDLTQRVDGNTLTFNLVAGVVHDHEGRITRLENRSTEA